jgi:tetratricopeptide (TPR) repeat protein
MRYAICMLALLLAAPTLLAQVSINEKPRRYLLVRCDGANRDWDIRPIRITDRGGRTLPGASEGDFKLDTERWERTGMPKRYNVELWRQAVIQHIGPAAQEGSRFYFYAIDPKQPRAEGNVNLVDERRRIYWAPASAIEVKGYPQTWINVYEAFVTRQAGVARQAAVEQWEEAHRDIIRNEDELPSPQAFTQEERNEFARFYQAQFVYTRDRDASNAAIYHKLAQFHRDRDNLDAELSTYLDALRAGVPSPDREIFALAVGRIFVNRLNLFGEAIPYLNQARNHSEALYLLARCHVELEEYDDARKELNGLIQTLNNLPGDDSFVLESGLDTELGRANLTLAELEFKLHDFAAAHAAVAGTTDTPSADAGKVLYCAMLLQRGAKGDASTIRREVRNLSFWNDVPMYLNPQPGTLFPLDPLIARALVIYAQTDAQFTATSATNISKPSAEALRYLNAARALDPLSAEPWHAEGRLYQRIGMFKEAMEAYQQGLDINPTHVVLNYRLADLNLKAGLLSVAKDQLGRCIRHNLEFYPAHILLGEIALSEVEDVRKSLLLRMSAGEEVDFAGELVAPMKEAAAFFSSGLAIQPDQPAAKLALATLYVRLSEAAPSTINNRGDAEAVRRAYLTKARELSGELVEQLEAFAEEEPRTDLTERERALIPSPACYNVHAFCLYALGDHGGALDVFRRHIANAANLRYFADGKAREVYAKTSELAYAKDWLERIERNQRQYFEVDEFLEDSTPNYYGKWFIPQNLKPDQGFLKDTAIRGGRLRLVVDQKSTGMISRFEIEKPHATLSTFEATFNDIGDFAGDRGVHLTKAVKDRPGLGGGEGVPKSSVMLGIDAGNNVFWEVRSFDINNKDNPDKERARGIIDISSYGGVPLKAGDRVKLAIRRQLSPNRGAVEYVGIINDFYEIRIPVELDELTKNDFNLARGAVHCGLFTRAFVGVKGVVEVESTRFIYDSGLAGKR